MKAATRTVVSGALLGLGIATFVDETIFHQLLHWHHFYDRAGSTAGLVSDGVLHGISWFATVAALFMLADLRRRGEFVARRWWGAVLAGAGAFQLYDGTVQHKLFRLHQIRYDVEIAPYDWVWNIVAIMLLAAGLAMLLRSPRNAGDRDAGPREAGPGQSRAGDAGPWATGSRRSRAGDAGV